MTLALPVYDPDKHHIGLGVTGGTSYGLILDGPYRKAFQRDEQVPVAFGGAPPTPLGPVSPHAPAFAPPSPAAQDPDSPPAPPSPAPPLPPTPALAGPQPRVNDLITDEPGSYIWTQDDYSGGIFQYTWRDDGAMILDSVNMAPRPFDRSLRTIPPLKTMGTRDLNGEKPLLCFAVDGEVCAVFSQGNGLFRFHVNGGGTAWHPLPGDPTAATAGPTAAAFDPAEKVLYIGHYGRGVGSNGSGAIWRFDCSGLVGLADGTSVPLKGNQLFLSPIDSVASYPVGLSVGGGGMVLSMSPVNSSTLLPNQGVSVWSCRLPDDTEDAAKQPTWTRVGDLGGPWITSAMFNGFIYILSSGAQGNAKLVALDPAADQLLPIYEFPYNFRGECLKVFGGRLYVGGSATDTGAVARFGELHEVSGNSARLVRSFGDEYRNAYSPVRCRSAWRAARRSPRGCGARRGPRPGSHARRHVGLHRTC